MNSRKEIKIRAFGCAMENSPENDFQCLVTFWKCYFPTNFSHFLSFQTNFILENPPAPAHQHPQKIHRYPHKTYHHTTQKPPKHHHNNNNKKIRDQREKDWEIEGKRDRSGKRDRFSAVATRSVLGGDDDNKMQGSDLNGGDVEEEEKKKEEAWPACDLGDGVAWSGLARAWLKWAWRWVLDHVRSVLMLELSLFRCGFRKRWACTAVRFLWCSLSLFRLLSSEWGWKWFEGKMSM